MPHLLSFGTILRAAAAVAVMAASHAPAGAHEVDLTKLPLGDGKLSQAPRKGHVWACRIDPQAGGARVDGPWIDASRGTYDLTRKAVVSGEQQWNPRFRIALEGGQRRFSTNDLPDHPTGRFPVSPDNDAAAYRVDPNPNTIREQSVSFELPARPEAAAQPQCAPGAVGVLLSGAVLFNALDAPGRDAVAHEVQDGCQGHPQERGVYHYHSLSNCVKDAREPGGHSALVGYIVDGHGLFGRHGENGRLLASADLDECHGHTHEIPWDGRRVVMYHYHATWDYPYTVGCLRGRTDERIVRAIAGPPPERGQRPPPPGAPGAR